MASIHISKKQQQTVTDYDLCIICQHHKSVDTALGLSPDCEVNKLRSLKKTGCESLISTAQRKDDTTAL